MGLIASMTVDELQQLLTRDEETVWVDRVLACVLPGLVNGDAHERTSDRNDGRSARR